MSEFERMYRFDIRVYYEDTDFSGVVYHANYLRFLERGRTEFLRRLGIHQTDLLAGEFGQSLAFAVADMTIAFRRAARMDDLVTVETALTDLRGASLSMRQRLLRGEEGLVEASVRVAVVSNGRAARLPAALAARIAPALGDRARLPVAETVLRRY